MPNLLVRGSTPILRTPSLRFTAGQRRIHLHFSGHVRLDSKCRATRNRGGVGASDHQPKKCLGTAGPRITNGCAGE